MKARINIVIFALSLCVALDEVGLAGTVRGTVTSTRGYPIKNVQVAFTRVGAPANEPPAISPTDANGMFQFGNVGSGNYHLKFRKEGWGDTERTFVVARDSESAVDEVPTVVLQPTLIYKVVGNLQAGSVIYLVLIGIATLIFNFYLVPEPSRGVTIVGWSLLGFATLIAALKLEWVDAAVSAVVGAAAAYVIQRYGRKYSARQLQKLEAEASEQQAIVELQRAAIESLVGQEGITLTDLKTCGCIEVAGKVVDARAGRGYVPRDTRVVVRRIDGKTPIVEVVEV